MTLWTKYFGSEMKCNIYHFVVQDLRHSGVPLLQSRLNNMWVEGMWFSTNLRVITAIYWVCAFCILYSHVC